MTKDTKRSFGLRASGYDLRRSKTIRDFSRWHDLNPLHSDPLMRIAFLGTNGLLSAGALKAVAHEHRIVAIARPVSTTATIGMRTRLSNVVRALGLRRNDSIDAIARQHGIMVTELNNRSDSTLAALLRQSRPDVLCVASFPWLLAPELLSIARLGAINVHAALLPRHRGPLPLFWIYHADDRESGVTVHWMDERADAGDVVAQSAFPLARGEPVDSLNQRNAEVAGPLLARALAAIDNGSAPRMMQDEARATAAPFVHAGTPMVAFDSWPTERVWHFLAGLYPRFVEPLQDVSGMPVRYRGVRGFFIDSHRQGPGTVELTRSGARLFCRDGWVRLRS
jgi:methionyl-tRNA formyltransferase